MNEVKTQMVLEAFDHYQKLVGEIDPEAAKEIFDLKGLRKFLEEFMVHQSAAYVFSNLCNSEQRMDFHHVTLALDEDVEGRYNLK
jgi:hypothetical protein